LRIIVDGYFENNGNDEQISFSPFVWLNGKMHAIQIYFSLANQLKTGLLNASTARIGKTC